ncbi:MAG: hypothetical protein NZ921_00270 [Candidatus Caldarchaeum sp.]|nr:hypothetical protein [Candidatus Caldarchaeum sp.]
MKFSPMFSDYNLLFMGRDTLEKKLEKLGREVAELFHGGKGLKTRIRYR